MKYGMAIEPPILYPYSIADLTAATASSNKYFLVSFSS